MCHPMLMGVSCEMLFCFTALTGCIVAQSIVQWLSAGSLSLLANICMDVKRQHAEGLENGWYKRATNQVLCHGKMSLIILGEVNNQN